MESCYIKSRRANKTNLADQILAFAVTVIMYYALFNGAIFSLFDRFGIPGKRIIDLALLLTQSAFIAMGLWIALQRNPYFTVMAYLSVGGLYLLTIVLYPDNTSILLGTCKSMFIFCLPTLILTYSLNDKELIWHMFCKGRYIMLFCGLIYAVFAELETYSMWLGYQMLLPCMLLTWYVMNGKAKLFDYIIWIVSVATMLIKGSRGPFFILVIYGIFAYLWYNCRGELRSFGKEYNYVLSEMDGKVFRPWKLVLCFAFAIIFIMAIVYLDVIAKWLYEFLLSHGYDTHSAHSQHRWRAYIFIWAGQDK